MIILSEKWALKSDEFAVVLCRHRPKKTDPSYYKPTYYYNNYADALQGWVDRELGEIDLSGFHQVIEHINKLYRKIEEIAPQLPRPSRDVRELDAKRGKGGHVVKEEPAGATIYPDDIDR